MAFRGEVEEERTEALETACGGPDATFRLMRILTAAGQSASGNRHTTAKMPTTADIFRKHASQEGYSGQAINLMLGYDD